MTLQLRPSIATSLATLALTCAATAQSITEVPSNVNPMSMIDMDAVGPVGPTTLAAINAAANPAGGQLANIALNPSTAAAGVYNTNPGQGRALGLDPSGVGLTLMDPPNGAFAAFNAQIDLGPSTEFAIGIADWVGPMILDFYSSGTFVTTFTTSTYNTAAPKFFQFTPGGGFADFDRIDIRASTTAGNWVITDIGVEIVGSNLARNVPYGDGCPGPGSFYELFTSFDLANSSILLQPNTAGGWTVQPGSGTIDPNFTGNLNLSDDQMVPGNPLGFSINLPGVGSVSTVDIDSNGRCGWGLAGSDYTESVAEFLATPMLTPFWDDLNPANGGGVYFDQLANYTMITWDQVPEFSASGANTAQIKFYPQGLIEITWGACSLLDCLTGYSDGSNNDPGGRDISTSMPFITTGGGLPVNLAASARPIINTTINMNTSNIPTTAVAGALLAGFTRINLGLGSIGMVSCSLLTSAEVNFGGFTPQNPTVGVAVINDPALNGLSMYWQSVVIAPGANTLGVLMSQGIETQFGLN